MASYGMMEFRIPQPSGRPVGRVVSIRLSENGPVALVVFEIYGCVLHRSKFRVASLAASGFARQMGEAGYSRDCITTASKWMKG